jgi:hypothetical protein
MSHCFVDLKQLIDIGGSHLLTVFGGSLSNLLLNVYPNYDWLPWKFTMLPQRYWDDVKNQRKFMQWASKELNIKEMNDWYKATHRVFLKL